ncbi:MAG: aliphatic sulfonate ABC transporter substrate-binding protein [Gluconacetobacter sp.]
MMLPLSARLAHGADGVVRIGYQKYGSLILLKRKRFLDDVLAGQGVAVQWAQFPAGPPMLQAMASGALDFGQTGDLPPIFAQASAPDELVYVGHEPQVGSSEAIIVPAGSSVRTIGDLRGRKVAVTRGSDAHWLLLAALLKNGLSLRDVSVSYLLPASARPAFETGDVDAWSIWDPFLSAVGHDVRVLVTGADVGGGTEFFLARRVFAEGQATLLKLIRDAVARCDAWAQANKQEVVQILAAATGLDPAVVTRSVAKVTYGIQPIGSDTIARQQHIADTFHKAGLLSAAVNVREAVLPFEQ